MSNIAFWSRGLISNKSFRLIPAGVFHEQSYTIFNDVVAVIENIEMGNVMTTDFDFSRRNSLDLFPIQVILNDPWIEFQHFFSFKARLLRVQPETSDIEFLFYRDVQI